MRATRHPYSVRERVCLRVCCTRTLMAATIVPAPLIAHSDSIALLHRRHLVVSVVPRVLLRVAAAGGGRVKRSRSCLRTNREEPPYRRSRALDLHTPASAAKVAAACAAFADHQRRLNCTELPDSIAGRPLAQPDHKRRQPGTNGIGEHCGQYGLPQSERR